MRFKFIPNYFLCQKKETKNSEISTNLDLHARKKEKKEKKNRVPKE